mgnify:CR=1 FL=1
MRIANGRNKILEKAKGYDFLIMLDLDDVNISGKFIDSIDKNNYKQIVINDINIHNLTSYSNKQFYEFEPIKYAACGLLGDFINQLSIICEKFYETGRKGVLYIFEKEGFSQLYEKIVQLK